MTRRLRDDGGIALVSAIIMLLVLMGLGLGVASFADSEQRASGSERLHESSFNQGEAVLNAQVFQLARSWPTASAPATSPCVPTTPGAGTAATTCPEPAGLADSFTSADYTAAAGCAYPAWQTVIQDDDPALGGTKYYDPVGMNPATHPAVPYDANGNDSVWVRATAAPKCRRRTIVAIATRALIPLDWPRSVLTANWFKTGNKGNKVIINTLGPSAAQAGDVSLRCTGLTTTACKQYKAGQVAPDTIPASPPGGTPLLNATQIEALRQQAKQSASWYPGCPAGVPLGGLAQGTVVFVEGSAACATSGSGNTAAAPVTFVVHDGRFSLSGNARFYGLVYAVNASNLNTTRVTLAGCARIQGMIAVDGLGGVDVGACKQNLVYDPSILGSLRTYGGAVVAKNSFRVLRGNAP
jgi:hypothetical protein